MPAELYLVTDEAVRAGADSLAVISAILSADDPRAVAAAFGKMM